MSEQSGLFHEEAILELPFVNQSNDGCITFWNTEASGHQDTDVELGSFYAHLAIETSRHFQMPELIAMVMRDMTFGGRFGPLEAGFISVVASAARAGRMH